LIAVSAKKGEQIVPEEILAFPERQKASKESEGTDWNSHCTYALLCSKATAYKEA